MKRNHLKDNVFRISFRYFWINISYTCTLYFNLSYIYYPAGGFLQSVFFSEFYANSNLVFRYSHPPASCGSSIGIACPSGRWWKRDCVIVPSVEAHSASISHIVFVSGVKLRERRTWTALLTLDIVRSSSSAPGERDSRRNWSMTQR